LAEPANFADWLAICNLKAAYCRLLDTKDWEGWGALFTEDFHQDVSGSGGGVYDGRAAAVAETRAAIETTRSIRPKSSSRASGRARSGRSMTG
jgi:hypothetical protein